MSIQVYAKTCLWSKPSQNPIVFTPLLLGRVCRAVSVHLSSLEMSLAAAMRTLDSIDMLSSVSSGSLSIHNCLRSFPQNTLNIRNGYSLKVSFAAEDPSSSCNSLRQVKKKIIIAIEIEILGDELSIGLMSCCLSENVCIGICANTTSYIVCLYFCTENQILQFCWILLNSNQAVVILNVSLVGSWLMHNA